MLPGTSACTSDRVSSVLRKGLRVFCDVCSFLLSASRLRQTPSCSTATPVVKGTSHSSRTTGDASRRAPASAGGRTRPHGRSMHRPRLLIQKLRLKPAWRGAAPPRRSDTRRRIRGGSHRPRLRLGDGAGAERESARAAVPPRALPRGGGPRAGPACPGAAGTASTRRRLGRRPPVPFTRPRAPPW